jgi:hypothetical protein
VTARGSDVLELLRAPAAFSAVGDSLVGAYAGGSVRPRQLLTPIASVLIYAGGMGLNDWADREIDAVERPERPIPSGRISPQEAVGISTGLLAGGVAMASIVGGARGAARGGILAVAVVLYDTVAKETPVGPWVMATCRALDVLLGAGSLRSAVGPALTVGAHTVAVTYLSRAEVSGAERWLPESVRVVVAGLAAVATLGGRAHSSDRALRVLGRVAATGAAARYLTKALPPLNRAVQDPDAARIRDAVRANLGAMIPLQAALIARTGRLVPAAFVASLEVAQRQVIRRLRGDTT